MKKSYLLLRLTLLMGLLGGGLTRPLAWAQVTPDISTTLSATPASLNATASVTLTVGVTNTGSGAVTATNVTRTVTGLPTGLSGVTFGGAGAANATYNSGAGSVTFTGGPYSLAASGASLNYTITFTVPCGTASFTATSTVGCTSDTDTGNNTATAGVTVNNTTAPATPGAISNTGNPGALTLCRNGAGNTQNYAISAVTGATSYTWTIPTAVGSISGGAVVGANSVLTTASTTITVTPNNANSNNAGNLTVTASNACGTSSAQTLALIKAAGAPGTPTAITNTGGLCAGTQVTFTATPNGANPIDTYNWTVPAGWTLVSGQGTVSIQVTVGTATGNLTVIATNRCGTSGTRTTSFTPLGIQPTVTGNQTPCTGSVVTYTATAGLGTYAWTLPTGYSGSSVTNTINVTVGASAGNGTISATATSGGCTSTPGTLAITPTQTPTQPAVISGSTTPCQNSTGNIYSVASVPAGETYTWSYSVAGATFPGGNTGASVSVSFAAGAGNGNLIITPTAGTAPICSGPIRTLALTPLGAPPTPSAISGAAAPCVSSSRTYSVTNVAGLTYTWVVPAAVGTISSGQGTNSITVATAGTTGTGNITVTATYTGCTTASAASTRSVTSVASLPASAAIAGPAAPCAGATGIVYTATAVTGAVSYQWSVTGTGWSITANATTAAPTFTVGSGPGTLTVAAVNDCGPGATQTRIITPTSAIPAQPGAISGSGSIYINRTGNIYTIAAVPEAVSYTWTVPAAIGTITAGQGTTSITVTAAAATNSGNSISVVAINSCGTGPAQTLPVNVLDAPDVVTTVSAPAFADAGSSVYFTITYINIGSQNATDVVTNLAMSNSSGSVLTGISLSQSGVFTPTAADGGITGIASYGAITLNAGASTTRTFLITMPASGTLTGVASSTQTTTDANPANNDGTAPAATAIVTARQNADVITVVAGPQFVAPGRQVTYSITPTNQGPSVATNVATTLTGLPAGLTGVTVFAGGTYNSGTGTVTWPATAAIARGASLPLGVRFTAGASGTITVTASSTSTTPDPLAANNNGTGAQANLTTLITGAVSNTECSSPGIDGDLTTVATSVLNTYFPGTGTVSAGAASVTVGPVATGYGTAPIVAGDLVLLIQMQGADIDATNTDAYGSGVAGQLRANGALRNANYAAGLYEYRIAANTVPLTGGTITLTRPTSFGYTTAAATSSTGRRVYQVIRVPQYQTLTLGATLTAPRWDGTTGGVMAVDVAGATFFNGQTINLAGIGFRGAGGRQLGGDVGVNNTDYRHTASLATSAGKGEGIAGTPRYLNNAGVLLDQGFDGYPNGDYGRGAPGNAGGGGTDGRPSNNDENSGGGGGSNAGYGGRGGNSWNTNLENGGFGGGDFTEANPTRLILGGGGGAGTTNNGTGTPGAGFASSGAAGGGLLIMRTGSVNGTGTVNVSGADMTYLAGNDASGGGGGGGSAVLVANPGVSLSGLTILARGGNGGSNTGGGAPHGPGGGGSGGVVFTSNTLNAATSLQPGVTGSTSNSNIYGAGTGTAASGNILTNLVVADLPNLISGAACSADVVVTASGPAVAVAGASVIYTVSVTNLGLNTANGVVPTLTLPVGVTVTATPFGSTVSGNVVTLPAIGSIAVGAAAINYNVTFTMPAADVTGTAAATSASNDPVEGNNDGTATNANVTTRYNPAPVANPATIAAVNPGGTNTYALDNTSFSGTDDVSVASIRLTTFPTNATSITVNGTTYTAAGGGGTTAFPGAGITLPATAAGNLAAGNTILIDPVNNALGANLAVVLPYVLIDNDGGPSNPANITINFSDLTISGTLFHDLNGLTNNLIDGTSIGRTLTSNIQLYANLLNAAGTAVVASVTLPIAGAIGQYSFGTLAGLQQNTSYTVVLATANNSIVPVLPAGWVNTAEGTTTGDGTPDGSLTTALTTTAVSGANYGIEQRPTVGANQAVTTVNPGGTQTYPVTSTLFTGADVNGGTVTGLYFATFPANATSITLDGNFYTNATFPGAGVTVPANAAGNPVTQIRIDPVNNTGSNVIVVLSYQTVDNANVLSTNAATVTVTFTDITISGNVYNDGNGAAVTTTVPIGSAAGNQLYVNLVDGTGTVVGTSTVNTTTGLYSLGTANGTQTNTTFTTVLSTVQGVAGTTTGATPALPTGWVNTNDAVNTSSATGDGLANGQQSVSLVAASIGTILFAIEDRPTANPTNATVVVNTNNPGAATLYTVPAASFTASDPAPGGVTGLYLAAFPANANNILLTPVGGAATTYTSITWPAAGVTVAAAASGNPSQNIQIDPIDGTTTVALVYQAVDGAVINGVANTVRSLNSATVTVNFSDITLSGTVFQDVNGGTINGTGIGSASGSQLYVHLLTNTGTAIAGSVPATVNADGTYLLGTANGVRPSTTYRVVVSTSNLTTTTTSTLPTGWVSTAEGIGTAGDGTVNGIVTSVPATLAANTAAGGAGVSNINFGIEQRPVATANTITLVNLGGNNSSSVPAAAFAGTDPDAGGIISSIRLTAFPAANATSITVNGTTYTLAGGGGTTAFPGAGILLTTDANGNLAAGQTLTVNPLNGAVAVVLPFNVIDNANIASSATANLTINFTDLTISGTVLQDPDGLTDSQLNGTAVGSASGTALFANLLNAAGTAVAASVAVPTTGPTTGQYSFGTANGLVQNTSYTVVLTTTATSITPTLPTGWVNTAEGIAATGDGTINGSTTIALTTTAVAGANFGIEQRPVVNWVTNVPVNNTASASVLSAGLSATDADGTVSSFLLTSIPAAAAGTLRYNGTILTAGNIGTTVIPNTPASLALLTFQPVNGFVGNATFTYTATDNAGFVSTQSNNAGSITVSAATYTIPVGIADVATTITPSVNPVIAATALSFAVTYTNAGPNSAVNYTQTLTLTANLGAANVTFANLPTGVTAAYNNTTGVVTFTGSPTTLISGANQNLTVNIASVPPNLASVTVSTTVGTTTNQGADTGANSATVTVPVTPIADVTTSLTGPATVTTGVTTSPYTVTFTNNGPSTAAGVTQTVTLPAGATGITATGGTVSGTTITYPTGTLALGSPATFTFTYVPAAGVTSVSVTSNVGTSTSQGADAAPNSATLNSNQNMELAGIVFDDVNYGGGAGRTYAAADAAAVASSFASGAIRRSGARVELYDATGTYVTFATTDAAGRYSFSVAPNATYTVRVPNNATNSVSSVRTGTGTLPVQTFVNGNVNRVGGEAPEKVDAANGTTGTTLASLNTAATIAQSVTTVAVTTSSATTLDFGFNFNTVVSNRDAGQGSLRQFITNANALPNTNLAQAGQTAGRETTIWMVPNGATTGAPAGLRNNLVSGLTGSAGAARVVVTLASALPTLTAASTTIDGGTQTTNIGNTNTGTLGTSDVVGVDGLPVTALNRTEVEIVGNSSFASPLTLGASNSTLRNVAIRGGSISTVTINGTATTGSLLENNLIGTSAIAYAWAGDATVSGNFGVDVVGTAAATVRNNAISFTGSSGMKLNNGTTTVAVSSVTGNQFLQNGYNNAGGDGISLGDATGGAGPALIQGNLFTLSNSSAIQLEIGQTALTQMRNNTMLSCGKGGAGTALNSLEGSAICYLQRNGSRRGTTADDITSNLIIGTQASGIVVGYGQQNVTISRNSVYGSGSVAIDIVTNPNAFVGGPGSGAVEYGSGDGVTLNTGAVGTSASPLPNRGMNYPILTRLDVVSGNIVIEGFVKAGSTVEFFIPDLDPTRFGEGRTFLATRVEGSGQDTDGGTGAYGSAAINGISQGQDASASRFSFTLPFSSLTAQQQSGILASGLTATATLNANTSEFSGNVTLSADVFTTVVPLASPVSAGTTAQFTVTFSNNGPSTANGVVAQVQLPAGLTGVSVGGGGSYNNTTGLVTYPALTALPANTPTVSVITYTQPATTGAVTAAASVTTSTSENGLFANNAATNTILTAASFDLVTTISGPATTVAGQLVTYAVTTTDNGPSAAPNVAQTVQLPTGLAYVFVTNGGTYDATSGVVTFPVLAALAAGQSFNHSVAFVAPATSFSLTANVTPTAGDINLANNTAVVNTAVTGPAPATVANAYIEVTSDAPAGGVAPGTAVVFTVTQGNYGPQSATDVVARLALAPGLTGVVVSDGGAYSSETGLVTWPSVATQATAASRTLTVTANAPASGVLTATASVTTTTNDPVPADNAATTEVTINTLPRTDMRVVIGGPTAAIAGQTLSYAVTTTNAGLNPASQVVTTAQLPAGLASVIVSGGGIYNSTTGVVSWTTVGTYQPGDAVVNTISFTAPLNGLNPLPLAATVRSTTTDTNPANNTSSLSTSLQAFADLALSIGGPSAATVGSPITYIVSVANNGPAVSTGSTVTVQLPTNLTGVTASNGGTYNAQTGLVTFPAIVGQLPGSAGGLTYSINLTAPDRSSLTPIAYVTPTTNDDPVVGNNTASVNTTLSAPSGTVANLATNVVSNLTTRAAGLPITLTVTTQNLGPATGTGVTQLVALRPGLTGVTVSNGGTYDAVTGLVTWTDASLANATTLTRTIILNVPGTGPLVATATVSGNETDSAPANNRASTSVTVTANADVSVAVSGPATAVPGATVTYSVTTNNLGASPAAGVVTTLQLPAGLTGVVVSGGGSYNFDDGLVTWPEINTQAIGSAGVVTNTVTITAPATATFTATGNVTTTATDPVASNNQMAVITTTTANLLPVAYDVVNALQAPRSETATTSNLISPLQAMDPDGTVATYTITSLPTAAQGVLSLNGSPVVLNQVLTPAQAALLTFDPAANFAGNAFFTYFVTDNQGDKSNDARYTIPVGIDNAVVYTVAPTPAAGVPYQNNQTLATAFDANGGEYTTGVVVTDAGVRLAVLAPGSNPLPAGVGLNATTGLLTVTDRTLLTPGSYTVNITTTDEFAGVTTTPVTLTISGTPLPVELIAFEAKARRQDALLTWATASERNAAYFAVERSLTGDRFTEIGRTDAHGTTSQRHDYDFTDRQIGQSVNGLVYYRLRQVDQDGTVTYTPVRTVRFSGKTEPVRVAFYPNPFTDALTLDLTALPAGSPVMITILDATGRLVRTLTLTGAQVQSVDLHTLASGTYVVRLTGADGFTATQRLTKE